MATGFSYNELNYARKKYYGRFHVFGENTSFLQKLINYSLTRIYFTKYTVINIKRKIYRSINKIFLLKKKEQNSILFKVNLDDLSIKKISEEIKTNNFTFVENFISTDSYQSLIDSWPNINHFNHRKKITYHYNTNFKYHHKDEDLDKTFKTYSNKFRLRKFYEFLIGEKFKDFYYKLLQTDTGKENFYLYSILSTMASKDSYLIPHFDGVAKGSKVKRGYNFIYFVDGYDKDLSLGGATGLYKDNEFKYPLLMPKTIKNSVLIYNILSTDFFHGFKSIECPDNTYRKTINFQVWEN